MAVDYSSEYSQHNDWVFQKILTYTQKEAQPPGHGALSKDATKWRPYGCCDAGHQDDDGKEQWHLLLRHDLADYEESAQVRASMAASLDSAPNDQCLGSC